MYLTNGSPCINNFACGELGIEEEKARRMIQAAE